jgi:hypothetical protein
MDADHHVSTWAPGGRAVLLAVLALGAAGIPLAVADTPLWWLGGSMLLAAGTLLARVHGSRLRARALALNAPRALRGLSVRPLEVLADVICAGIVLWLGATMMWDLAGGERPVGHQHAEHYARAFQLHERLASTGRLLGFSHDWFAGYPGYYVDPPGADLWVNAVHALGFGALGFGAAYALAVLLVHLLSGIAVYRFGRIVAGPPCGLIAAVLFLTDLSVVGLGGFTHAVEHGAWPEALSLALGTMALCSVPAIAAERRLAPLGAFALFQGLAILTHPVQLIALLPLLVCATLAAALADSVKAAAASLRLLLASALALLVAAPWLIPWSTSRGDTRGAGAYWSATYELAKGVLELRALPGTLGWVLALGVLGVVLMLRTRRFALLLTALLALCIPLVSSGTFVDELHLPALLRGLPRVELAALAVLARPLWFVLAAYFAVAAIAHVRLLAGRAAAERGGSSLAGTGDSHARAALFAAVLGLLTLPVLVPAAQVFWTRHVRKSIVTESERPLRRDRARLQHWLRTELPRDGFYRVGVFADDDGLIDLGVGLDRPVYARAGGPSSSFIYRIAGADPAVLEALNVRFAIARKHLPSDLVDPVVSLGDYRVYRLERYRPEPFVVAQGAGEVRVVRFGDEEIVLRAAPGSHGKLRLNVSYSSRWRAYRDGRRVPMTLTYLPQAPRTTGFMTVPLAPGVYRFAFERTLGDRLATPLGLLGVALCAWLMWAGRDERRVPRLLQRAYTGLDRLSEPPWARRRALLAGGAGALLLAAGVALALLRPPIAGRGLGVAVARVRFDFLEELGRAGANLEYSERNQPCLRQGERLVCRDEAGNLDNERYIASVPAAIEEDRMVRCIRARPEQAALLSISFPNVPLSEAIVGYYGIEREGQLAEGRRAVALQIMVDGTPVYSGYTQSDELQHWFNAPVPRGQSGRGTVTFAVRADNVSRRHFCFAAQMVELRK